MFLLISRYVKPLEEVDRWVREHRAYLDTHYDAGHLLTSGPQNPRTGGVIISKHETREQVDAFLAGDPFVREGVSEYEVIEFTPTRLPS
jgi:uncharacterized protein YciI